MLSCWNVYLCQALVRRKMRLDHEMWMRMWGKLAVGERNCKELKRMAEKEYVIVSI